MDWSITGGTGCTTNRQQISAHLLCLIQNHFIQKFKLRTTYQTPSYSALTTSGQRTTHLCGETTRLDMAFSWQSGSTALSDVTVIYQTPVKREKDKNSFKMGALRNRSKMEVYL